MGETVLAQNLVLAEKDIFVRVEQGNTNSGVSVTTDKTHYLSGELIWVSLLNKLPVFISAPPTDPLLCSIVSIEKWKSSKWIKKSSCDHQGTTCSIQLPSNSLMTAALFRKINTEESKKAHLSQPSVPGVLDEQSLIDKSWKSSDLSTIVPEGDINVRGFLCGTYDIILGTGIFRIVFNFTMGNSEEVTQTVYSEEIIIDD
ncbi:MAG: hypothetical protein GQ475_04215 [Methylococcaceae bacterium]|nr:hypothetical protein [Methylococcaceae bacterium]